MDYFINQYKDPYKTTSISWKVSEGPFYWVSRTAIMFLSFPFHSSLRHPLPCDILQRTHANAWAGSNATSLYLCLCNMIIGTSNMIMFWITVPRLKHRSELVKLPLKREETWMSEKLLIYGKRWVFEDSLLPQTLKRIAKVRSHTAKCSDTRKRCALLHDLGRFT